MDMAQRSGILPAHAIARLYETGAIASASPFAPGQVQPASLDLRLGDDAYRVRASFLPGRANTVEARLEALKLHRISLAGGAVLETGCVYIVPLQERLALPGDIAALSNPKSSTGRLDIFTRVIADHANAFDKIPPGYAGPLFAEISPRTFPVLVRPGSRLTQIRFRAGAFEASDSLIRELHQREPLVTSGEPNIDNGIALSVDLASHQPSQPIGYRAIRHSGLIDVDAVGALDARDYWEPIFRPREPDPRSGPVLHPGIARGGQGAARSCR